MSTNEQDITQIPPGFLSDNTIARSILSEQRDRRLEPEDLRTRRFGYNPGFRMEMDPVWSSLQNRLIPAGCLILFETSPVSRAKHSVDKDDKTPPNEIVDFLAGEGLRHVYQHFSGMGFRELLPLRGFNDSKAVGLFSTIHPRLRECYEREIIEPCVYGPKECSCLDHAFTPDGRDSNRCQCGIERGPNVFHLGECDYCTYVCITCRFSFLEKLKLKVAPTIKPLFDLVYESVTVGRATMTSMWNTIVGEVAAAQTPGTNPRGVLANITEDHMFIMRQLHQRTPSEMELAKISMNAKAQADVMKSALAEQAQILAAAMASNRSDDTEKAQMAERLRLLEVQIEKLTAAMVAGPGTSESAE